MSSSAVRDSKKYTDRIQQNLYNVTAKILEGIKRLNSLKRFLGSYMRYILKDV